MLIIHHTKIDEEWPENYTGEVIVEKLYKNNTPHRDTGPAVVYGVQGGGPGGEYWNNGKLVINFNHEDNKSKFLR